MTLQPMKALMLAALLAACSLSTVATAETIKIGTQPWLGYGPLWIAEEKGYFDDNGVDAELVDFTWDQDVNAALASGNIQVMAAATNTLITLINRDVDVKGFMLMDASYEADAILAPTDMDSVKDLEGRSIAYEEGATSDLLLNYALREHGLSGDDIEAVPMAASDAGFALISGRVDVGVTYEPYISAALSESDDYKVLYTSAERPGLISDVLVAQSDYIESNPAIIEGLILAWNDAVTFLRNNPDEGGRIIADAVGSPMEEFRVAFEGVRLYDLSENADALDGEFPETFKTVGRIMNSIKPGEITAVPEASDALYTDAVYKLAR